MLGFLDTFDAVAFPTFAMILFGVCLFVEKNAPARLLFTRPLLDEEDEEDVAALVLAHSPVRKVDVDAFCAAENMVDDDAMMMKKCGRQKELIKGRRKKKKTRPICLG